MSATTPQQRELLDLRQRRADIGTLGRLLALIDEVPGRDRVGEIDRIRDHFDAVSPHLDDAIAESERHLGIVAPGDPAYPDRFEPPWSYAFEDELEALRRRGSDADAITPGFAALYDPKRLAGSLLELADAMHALRHGTMAGAEGMLASSVWNHCLRIASEDTETDVRRAAGTLHALALDPVSEPAEDMLDGLVREAVALARKALAPAEDGLEEIRRRGS